MKGFLGDGLRLGWALLYWNARKARHQLGGAHGRAPCHHPSDSGRPGETGCDAVIGWRDPARFRRVCPLLVRRADGAWVCSVAAPEVRPFWGRAFAWYAGAALVVLLLLALTSFAALRVIGYRVTPRQVFWPPAWHEMRGAQSELFISRAREHFAAGRVREAISAVESAHGIDPRNYATGMMLAQFNRAGNPAAADRVFAQLLADHPERAVETARAWYLSLLARGQLATAAELASVRLPAEPEQAGAWTHALVFTSRHLGQPVVVEKAAAVAGVPPPVAGVLRLEAQMQREGDAGRRRALLRQAPLPDGFPYAWVHRAEWFIAAGFPADALQLLQAARDRGILGGRDILPLSLAARAAGGDTDGLAREANALLARGGATELGILARHLISHPDEAWLGRTIAALGTSDRAATEEWQSTGLALFCAAGVARERALMKTVRAHPAAGLAEAHQAGVPALEAFFLSRQQPQGLFVTLPLVDPLPLELLYSLVGKYLSESERPGRAPK